MEMLLYLVKHLRQDIANAVSESSIVLDGVYPAASKEMQRVIKYMLDIRQYGLRFEPSMRVNSIWDPVCYINSDYAGDPESRMCLDTFLYMRNVPICCQSKAERSVTLSSSEAEIVVLSETLKEMIFVPQLFDSMKINIT